MLQVMQPAKMFKFYISEALFTGNNICENQLSAINRFCVILGFPGAFWKIYNFSKSGRVTHFQIGLDE